MASVTLFTVTHHPLPDAKVCRRVNDALSVAPSGRVMIIDNGPSFVDWDHSQIDYHWNQGFNCFVGGAIDQALKLCRTDLICYFCSNHGGMIDRTWLEDLVAPFADPRVAMAGDVWQCNGENGPQKHVQGGLWAGRTDTLKAFRFGNRFPQVWCDVDISWRLQQSGYKLAHVPTVRSLAGGKVPDPSIYKYVHDHA